MISLDCFRLIRIRGNRKLTAASSSCEVITESILRAVKQNDPNGSYNGTFVRAEQSSFAGDSRHRARIGIVCVEEKMAEREGFEPPGPCGPAVFKTAAIDHSATSPATEDPTI